MGVELIRPTKALGVAVTMKGGEGEKAELLGPLHYPLTTSSHWRGWEVGGRAVRKFDSLEKIEP